MIQTKCEYCDEKIERDPILLREYKCDCWLDNPCQDGIQRCESDDPCEQCKDAENARKDEEFDIDSAQGRYGSQFL